MLVGIYSRLNDVVKFFHWSSSSYGGVLVGASMVKWTKKVFRSM